MSSISRGVSSRWESAGRHGLERINYLGLRCVIFTVRYCSGVCIKHIKELITIIIIIIISEEH